MKHATSGGEGGSSSAQPLVEIVMNYHHLKSGLSDQQEMV